MFPSNQLIIVGGLATTDESQIIFQQPSFELETFRSTLVASPMFLSQQVREAVRIRNMVARNDNLLPIMWLRIIVFFE